MSSSLEYIDVKQARQPFYAGIDLGGTSVTIGVVDDLGRPVAVTNIPTKGEQGPHEGMWRVTEALNELLISIGLGLDDLIRIGIGTPGTMNIRAGLLITLSNLPNWQNFPICEELHKCTGLPVTLSNDASAAAYGEYWVGAGQQFNSMVLFTLGTGIGGGIILNGQSLIGENSSGAELGHITIDCTDSARPCGCGQRGHLEAYASATAVISRTREALDAGAETAMRERLAEGEKLTPKLVAEVAETGDMFAMEIVNDTAAYLGMGIVDLLHTIDPSGVVLGGAMNFGGDETELGRHFLDTIRSEVLRRALAPLGERIEIKFASLGADSGFIGAAGIARAAESKSRQPF